jgi:hypothetical protein
MGLLARWLLNAIRLGLALALGVAAMQIPAFAHQYGAALVQITEDAGRDIEQRKDAARHFYPAAGETDETIIATLRAAEPANAQSLETSVRRARDLRATHDRIEAASPLLRPLVVLCDALANPMSDQTAVLWTTLDTYARQLVISTASATYGLIGFLLGCLVAEVLDCGDWRIETGVTPAMVEQNAVKRASF